MPTATRKGQKLEVLASYSENLQFEDQRRLRKEWHAIFPQARWLRFDEIGRELHTSAGLVATLPDDYKFLVIPADGGDFTWMM